MKKYYLFLLLFVTWCSSAHGKCTVSPTGVELVKYFEDFRSHPYHDIGNKRLTIGYGHQETAHKDAVWTKKHATKMLLKGLNRRAQRICDNLLVDINQHQLDALTSLAYNIGTQALLKSTLFKHVNTLEFSDAAKEFVKFNRSNSKVVRGLTIRRQMEQLLFLSRDFVTFDIDKTVRLLRQEK